MDAFFLVGAVLVQVSIILGDEVLLQPHLQMQPMYVCHFPTLYENMDAQAEGAKVVAAVNRQCFCRLNLRSLRHQKPLRRHFVDIPWETWNWLVPERCIMAAIWFLESKLSPQSSGSVTKKAKMVSIRDARLKMLLQLEDVDSTYGPFCPNVLAAFDICYLVMLFIVVILPMGLAIVVNRKYLAFKKFVFRTFYNSQPFAIEGGSGGPTYTVCTCQISCAWCYPIHPALETRSGSPAICKCQASRHVATRGRRRDQDFQD